MGFLSELGKAFIGKPLGPAGDKSQDDELGQSAPQNTSPASAAPQSDGVLDERGYKIIPTISFKNFRSQRQGDKRLIVKAFVSNDSDQQMRIDTSNLLKQKRTHNQFINPRDAQELTLYDGEIPDNEHEHSAQIAYRLQVNGDVFMENYRVSYSLESDGKRIVEDLIDDGPVRDI